MKILHISSDYPYTSVYEQLLLHFSCETGQSHLMYAPLPASRETPLTHARISPNSELLYSNDYGNLERLLYWPKLTSISRSIEEQVCVRNVSAVHAHYLFSAGGVALRMKQYHGIPYIVAVRSTDINVFFRYALHLRHFGIRILQNADRIIFISPSARRHLMERYVPKRLRDNIWNKSEVVPNGIDDFWLKNVYSRHSRPCMSRSMSLLYVGEVSKNKNIETSIKVTDALQERGYDAHLDIVGDGPDMRRIAAMAHGRSRSVRTHGRIASRNRLMEMYRKADVFIMPSIAETFGLVYAEAMSQGLPIVYTKGQGIDGYFEDGLVGYGCAPRDHEAIADRVEQILKDYDSICANCTEHVHEFEWSSIASRYERIYALLGQHDLS